jgi:hypothetical protein
MAIKKGVFSGAFGGRLSVEGIEKSQQEERRYGYAELGVAVFELAEEEGDGRECCDEGDDSECYSVERRGAGGGEARGCEKE